MEALEKQLVEKKIEFLRDVLNGLGMGEGSMFSSLHVEKLNTITSYKYGFRLLAEGDSKDGSLKRYVEGGDIRIVYEIENETRKVLSINVIAKVS